MQVESGHRPKQDRIVADDFLREIGRHCPPRPFSSGEVLRQQGLHYRDMLYLIDGRASVRIAVGDDAPKSVSVGPGNPIGEIGFLNGCTATATVVAETDGTALLIDDDAVTRIEAERPEQAALLMRNLADTSASRLRENGIFNDGFSLSRRENAVEVLLCRTDEMVREAQRLRYTVYCEELGRNSPNADHQARILTDHLDSFAHIFLARSGEDLIGTVRLTSPAEGPVGILDELYGMAASPHYPERIGVVTKFVIKPAFRGGLTALKMISAITRYGDHYDARECYIDCVPGLLHYYQALGFEVCGPAFLHRENGTSIPMRLDLVRYGPQLKREPGPAALIGIFARAKLFKFRRKLAQRLNGRSPLQTGMEGAR